MKKSRPLRFMPSSAPNELSRLLKDLFAIRRLNRDSLNTRFSASLDVLECDPVAALELARQLRSLFYTPSLTDSGINSSLGFFPELRQRFRHRILPPINEDHFFSHFVSQNFTSKGDYEGLEKLSDQNWSRVFSLVEGDKQLATELRLQLVNAIIIITHRFVAIGIDPYVVRKIPQTDDVDSPFFQLNLLVNEYLKPGDGVSLEQLWASLDKCEAVFHYLKANRATLGISLHLTFIIRRAEQHVARLRLLIGLLSADTREKRDMLLKELVLTLVRADLYSNGIRHFISENTSLLANRIANQTSSRGGDYIGFTRKANNRLLLSAMGGGLVVVLLVYIKHYIHRLHLPLLPEGLLFGINYGLGFVLMHIVHWTLATKQPAMTASYIAESIERRGLSKEARRELSVILAQIMRSQFISLIGNLIVVLPLSFFSAWLLLRGFWIHVHTPPEAMSYLKGNHPLLSASLLFAVFTGVFLTLAGLITGYYDNKVVFSDIPRRILAHPVLRRIMPRVALQRLADIISRHSGAVIGNLALGLFLGLAGTFGQFIGIPFDIRHITISAGNFGIAVAQGYGFSAIFVATVFGGVILIGLINIISSFLFSFLIACRSRYLTSRQTWLVLASMITYILRNPGILVFRKEEASSGDDMRTPVS